MNQIEENTEYYEKVHMTMRHTGIFGERIERALRELGHIQRHLDDPKWNDVQSIQIQHNHVLAYDCEDLFDANNRMYNEVKFLPDGTRGLVALQAYQDLVFRRFCKFTKKRLDIVAQLKIREMEKKKTDQSESPKV
jgi:hypothetical protein